MILKDWFVALDNLKEYLVPFTLPKTGEFLNELKSMNFKNRQILDTYMILGRKKERYTKIERKEKES